MLALLASASLAPQAAALGPPPSLVPTGTLTWVWRADPARGCAAAGLCGTTGSIEVDVTQRSEGQGGSSVSIGVGDPGAVARVYEPSGSCTDLVPVSVSLSNGSNVQPLSFSDTGDGEAPSSGRCAGPTQEDLLRSQLPVRRLAGGGYDFSATTGFGAGPFDVALISTLTARRGSPSGVFAAADRGSSAASHTAATVGPRAARAASRARRRSPAPTLFEYAEAAYRVRRVSGALSVGFLGLPSPLCDPADACGTAGTLSERAEPSSATLDIGGEQTLHHRVAAPRALADLRAGRLGEETSFTGMLPAVLTETLSRAGGPACTQARFQPDLSLTAGDPTPRMISLNPPSTEPSDSLRTPCPGPSRADILGDSPLAAGSLSLRAIGARALRIVLREPGGFEGLSYAGARHGALVLTLRLVLLRAGTSRSPPSLLGLP